MTIVIITSYVLSALSGLCNLVPSLLYVLPTQMWDVLKKCDVFQKAMQLSVHDQCGALVKNKNIERNSDLLLHILCPVLCGLSAVYQFFYAMHKFYD